MDWTTGVVLGLLVVASTITIYRAWSDTWSTNRTVGMAILLDGAAVGSLFDDGLAAHSVILPWVEPAGAVLVFVGVGVSHI